METETVYGTNVTTDLWGNVTLNLTPTPGHLVKDGTTTYFVPENPKYPLERYQAPSSIYVSRDIETAKKIYEQRLDALIDTAMHMLSQVTYCKAKYELETPDDSKEGDENEDKN